MSYVKCGDDSECWVVQDVRLYSVLDTVVISGDDVCCSVWHSGLITYHELPHLFPVYFEFTKEVIIKYRVKSFREV